MILEDHSFLKHFITEEVYVLDKNTIDENELVPNESEKVAEEQKSTPIKLIYSGANQKEVLVLINYTSNIADEDKELLFKILKAIQLTDNDIMLLNISQNSSEQHADLLKNISCKKIISFGTNCPSLFPDTVPNYQISIEQNRTILKSHPINEIASDVEKKKLLWSQLQKAFSS